MVITSVNYRNTVKYEEHGGVPGLLIQMGCMWSTTLATAATCPIATDLQLNTDYNANHSV